MVDNKSQAPAKFDDIEDGKEVAHIFKRSKKPAPILCIDLENQLDLRGQHMKGTPYASVSILDPVITIELHGGKYHIAARFNIEATILDYHLKKRDGHELYFHDICLQYRNRVTEELVMKPETSDSGAFNVTKSTSTAVNPSTGLNLGPTPTANVSLGLTHTTRLTVQYNVNTWTTSAHRVTINSGFENEPDPSKGKDHHWRDVPQYQWYWAGTQEETKKLTPDLKNAVKRHIVARREIPIQNFPTDIVETVKAQRLAEKNEQEIEKTAQEAEKRREKRDSNRVSPSLAQRKQETREAMKRARKARRADELYYPSLQELLTFNFSIQIRVKRRYGRLHRLMALSFNPMKSSFMKPAFIRHFSVRPEGEVSCDRIPLSDTYNIATTLDKLKEKHLGDWEKLQGQRVVDMLGYEGFSQPGTVMPSQPTSAKTTARKKGLVTERAASVETAKFPPEVPKRLGTEFKPEFGKGERFTKLNPKEFEAVVTRAHARKKSEAGNLLNGTADGYAAGREPEFHRRIPSEEKGTHYKADPKALEAAMASARAIERLHRADMEPRRFRQS